MGAVPGEAVLRFWREEVGNFFDDVSREHAVRHSHLIAREIGPEQAAACLEEILLPLEISDAVLVALARSLGKPEFKGCRRAFNLLVWLLEKPEREVRNAAVKGVVKQAQRGQPLVLYPEQRALSRFDAAPGDPPQEPEREELLLLPALCDVTPYKSFYQRVAVCSLLAQPIRTGLTNEQEADMVMRLSKDQVPQVRLAVARLLGEPQRSADGRAPRANESQVPPATFKDLMVDPDDLVQSGAIEHCLAAFLIKIPLEQRFAFLSEDLVHSSSWRARFALAKQLDFVFKGVHPPSAGGNGGNAAEGGLGQGGGMDVDSGIGSPQQQMMKERQQQKPGGAQAQPQAGSAEGSSSGNSGNSGGGDVLKGLRGVLMELFTDPEPDVRAEAAKHVTHFVDAADEFGMLLVTRLVEDEDSEVRKAVLSCFPGLAKLYSADVARLLSHIIVGDSEADVRTIAVKTFFEESIIGSLTKPDCLEVLRTIYSSTSQPVANPEAVFSWRTKNEAVKAIPSAARHVSGDVWAEQAGGMHFFSQCLQDHVYSVRETALKQLGELTRLYGQDWVRKKVAPLPATLFKQADYKVRMSSLALLHELHRVGCTTESHAQLLRMAQSDPVPNVRAKAQQLFPQAS